MKYITIILLSFLISCNECLVQQDVPITLGNYIVHRGSIKEIVLEIKSYELGDEWLELKLYRDNVYQASDKQFNTAEFSEAQKLTYRFTTDGKVGVYKISNEGKYFDAIILNINKIY